MRECALAEMLVALVEGLAVESGTDQLVARGDHKTTTGRCSCRMCLSVNVRRKEIMYLAAGVAPENANVEEEKWNAVAIAENARCCCVQMRD